ncbi:MAG: hypothetical protein ABL870_12255, partial [Sediminibacterium sp.]
MKKQYCILVLIISIFFASIKPCEASLVLPTQSLGLRFLYLSFGASSIAQSYVTFTEKSRKENKPILEFFAASFLIVGILLLDSNERASNFEFTQLSDEEARDVGVAAGDLVEYNNNIDRINLATEHI